MISTFFHDNFVIAARPDAKAKTIEALIAAAKSAPDTVTDGSAGTGTGQHLATELLGYMAGVKFVHVPYKGEAPALTGILGGDTQFGTFSLTVALKQIRAGKIQAIAVARTVRCPDRRRDRARI